MNTAALTQSYGRLYSVMSNKFLNCLKNGLFAFLDALLPLPIKKGHFFSSDESEGEEDHRKKFKIKIKPLPSNRVTSVPSVDELKASIGNIALSPSPMVSCSESQPAFINSLLVLRWL